MVTQTVLPFKLESTDEVLTAHAGLALLGEFAKGIGLPQWVASAFERPGSVVGYPPWEYLQPLLLMLHGGGRSLEDLRMLREDRGLLDLLKVRAVPSSDAVGDWLRRQGKGSGLDALDAVNRRLIRATLRADARTEYTLDIDASQIVAEKRSATWTYKGERGYMPMVGHLAENGLVLGDEFREGNVSPSTRNLEFIQHCAGRMPEGKRVAYLRADSAAYQAEIFNWCEENGVEFAIGADLDAAVKSLIAALPESGWVAHRDGEIAETVHCMNKTRKAFRLIVLRRPIQADLFEPTERYRYSVIASNRTETAGEVFDWYCQRGEASENRIKELKIGFGMERMPCGQFEANAMFFRIGVLAYNLFVRFKHSALSSEWHRHQVQTLRWRFYQAAGRIVRHAGQIYLKVSEGMRALYQSVRERSWEIACRGGT